MIESRVVGEVDLVSVADVTDLSSLDPPCVSVFMPTHRHGRETVQGPIRLRNLLDRAAAGLADSDTAATLVHKLLDPLRALGDDAPFWQHQSDGLALFAAPGFARWFRLPISFAEDVSVAGSFRVRPLVPLLSGDGVFFVLALSQNSVRLFEATRHTIGALDTGPLPTSMDDALAYEDPQAQLQVRSGGGGTAQFHGHGEGAEIDKATLERYFRVVDRGVVERLGSSDAPLVLACVDYYLPMYRAVTRYPNVVDAAVEGNPDRNAPEELHAAAWPLVEAGFATQTARNVERYRQAAGTGKTVVALDEIAARAREGRIDTLLVDLDVEADLDRAVLDTLTTGGRVIAATAETLGAATGAAALLRY